MNGYRDNLARFKSSYGDLLNQHRALKAEHEKLSTQLTEKTAQLGEVEQLKARLDTLAAEKTRIEEALARERAEWQKKLQDEANRLEGLLQAERAKATAAAAVSSIYTLSVCGVAKYCFNPFIGRTRHNCGRGRSSGRCTGCYRCG